MANANELVPDAPVKFLRKFVKWVKHSGSDEDFPEERINANLVVASYRLFKEWDSIKNDEDARKEFLRKFRHDRKIVENLGFMREKK